ncbi:MAG: DotD/TraH family lipoprotein [Desulfovibrionaceae bacterium]|nr:DotD/TraH family lipoprotein [Desulfovibrionaceae bacterium]
MARRFVSLAVLLLLCVSCVQKPKPGELSYLDQKLSEVAESIRFDLSWLAGTRERIILPQEARGDLLRRMDLLWDGPIEIALARVAAQAGFRFEKEGKEPETPVCVRVHLKDRTCLAILRELSFQTGAGEGLAVSEEERTITLRYIEKNERIPKKD